MSELATADTDTIADDAPVDGQTGGASTRRRIVGIGCIALGAITIALFSGSAGTFDTTFVFTERNSDLVVPDLVFPTRVAVMAIGVLIAGCGGALLARRSDRGTNTVLALCLALFVIVLLAWAARDDSTSVIGLLQGSIRRSIPIALGALAGCLCERSGVINIAIEGMLLAAAFMAGLVAAGSGNLYVGLLAAIATGALFGAVLAVLSIRYKVDQIVGGTVINIFALGLTSFLGAQVFVEYPDLNRPGTFRPFEIPVLSRIPVAGPLLFDNTPIVFLMFALVIAINIGLFRTRWGLRLRSVGEHPRAADTVGINVLATRYRAVTLGGAVAGVGGAFFTIDSVSGFNENMTAGRGFIALAALIFGRYHPVGALMAALVFGFAEEFQSRLALLDTPIPSEFLLMAPYLVTIIVVAGLVGRSRVPAADGQIYETG